MSKQEFNDNLQTRLYNAFPNMFEALAYAYKHKLKNWTVVLIEGTHSYDIVDKRGNSIR